jgi:signal recognition particle subunit SRP54
VFQSLRERLSNTFRTVSGTGSLSEENIKQALRDVKMALLEADVNFRVVKEFTSHVKEKCVGLEVAPGLNPGQQFVKFVHEELVEVMGREVSPLLIASQPPTIIMVVGLQGSGKTTTIGKLSNYLRKHKKKKPLLIAADIYRPAAIDQLEIIGKQLAIPVHSERGNSSAVSIVNAGLDEAIAKGNDLVIIDTAGRLHIDDKMMEELDQVKAAVKPHEILLVVDSMTGQDAVEVADTFHKRLQLTGVILTKLDGDARGGAALSVRKVTGCPVKFIGVGEKLDAIEPFHPDRMAQRILGMGDVLSLIEKVESTFDEESMSGMQNRLMANDFNLQDYMEQMRAMKKLGPLGDIMKMIPGLSSLLDKPGVNLDGASDMLAQSEAIISSMTKKERLKPGTLNGSRRKRIASGSGTTVQDVNQLIKQFDMARGMMKQMKGLTGKGGALKKGQMNKLKGMGFPFS